MLPRPKNFLTLLALFLLPLLLVACLGYVTGLFTETTDDRKAEVTLVNYGVNRLLNIHDDILVRNSSALLEIASARTKSTASREDDGDDLRKALSGVLNPSTHFVAVAAFDRNKRQLFFAESGSNELVIREKDFLPGRLQPDERSWTETVSIRSAPYVSSLHSNLQISVPVLSGRQERLGVVTGEMNLTSLLREAVETLELDPHNPAPVPRDIMITDGEGRILYHPNPAFLHQSVGTGESKETRIPNLNLFVSPLDDPDAKRPFKPLAAATIVLSVLLAAIAAFLLARIWERRSSGIEKVSEGVAAIAHGNLDHRIDALSSDAIRPISDNLNLMTAQLREQIARETEARQFQSFVRLSAMLTHDLKNAIEALSLIVSNMERHFDNEAFRADAMKSLNLATQNLRRLVDRLTNPVTTLSGEYKRPQPVDLVALLKRVIKLTASPALGEQQIETKLPNSLAALVDAERIEKVVENLIINALEAMGGTGKLSVTAGDAENGKVFFSVSDTGPGMSRDFIERQLFRPFATTKKRGVGLGLYTCREVVRANGGAIEVDSREGAGTTFRVVLPSATIEKV